VGAVYVLFLNADATVKRWQQDQRHHRATALLARPVRLVRQRALARLGGSPNDGCSTWRSGAATTTTAARTAAPCTCVQLNDGTAPRGASSAPRKTFGVAPMTVNFSDTSR
jgi:hypothetical protein